MIISVLLSVFYSSGICVLEEQLILQESDEPRPAKRGRTDGMNVSKDVPSWIELAR